MKKTINVLRIKSIDFLLSLLLLLLPFIANASNNNEFYRRHIMIVVDKTPDVKAMELFYAIESILQGKDPSSYIDLNKSDIPTNFTFNPKTDEISLYAFGIWGACTLDKGSGFAKIHGSKDFFGEFSNQLIHPRSTFRTSGKNLDDFIRADMKNLFGTQDDLYKKMTDPGRPSGYPGMTMSHYVWPTILNYIKPDSKASEYYVIIVTNYKGGAGLSDTNDESGVNDLAGKKKEKVDDFFRKINSLRRPFYTTNWIQLRGKNNPGMYANGMQLGVKSLQGLSVFVASNHDIEQTTSNRDKYIINPLEIAFNKNNTIRIDSIKLAVTDNDGELITTHRLTDSKEEAEKWFDLNTRCFNIPKQEVEILRKNIPEGDLKFEYQFYATVLPDEGGVEIPYVFTATSMVGKSDISFVNDKKRNMIITLCAIAAVLLILFIMAWRGRKRKLEATVHNFTTRFSMTTYEDGTVELPCWFVAEGHNSVGIKIDGNVKPVCGQPRIPRKDSLFVTIDVEELPKGISVCINDNKNMPALENEYYPIPLEDQTFKFNLNFWIAPNEFDFKTLQRVKLRLRYKTETKLGPTSKIQYHPADSCDAQLIEFFIKSEIGIAWIGIDPGTTGSCIAIGRGGVISNPNIKLIECNKETIIPSRLVFSEPTFKDIDSARPGKDYVFGFDADKKWAAFSNNGYDCFQSIKKLLGYQKGEDNKIPVKIPKGKERGSEVKNVFLSGLDLAHLLIKGLMKAFDNYKETLSPAELASFEPNGLSIRRAVVAIPNNYTLPKTLDMIESVAKTGRFDEVRPIFEAEAILCNYLSKTAGNIYNGQKNIIVYDMGGATINLTAFNVSFRQSNGSIYYKVRTLGRIGYAVGGDNIDFALMKCIFKLTDLGNGEDAKEYQEKNKVVILNKILALKKAIILYNSTKSRSAASQPNYEMLSSLDSFKSWVNNMTGKDINKTKFLEGAESTKDFTNYVVGWLTYNSVDMRNYVKKRIQEVTKEILTYPDVKEVDNIDEIIFSGRSVLFPTIKECAMASLKDKFGTLTVWDGLSDTEVKTAVAYGACWYGVFNSLVAFDNSRVASAYGFKLTELGKSKLNVMVDQNESFGKESSICSEVELSNDFASDGNIVEFYQVMGSPDGENLFDKNNRYKLNKIGEIPINVATESLSLEIKRSNQVDFAVRLQTGIELKHTDIAVPDRDITDENDEAYVFATKSK